MKKMKKKKLKNIIPILLMIVFGVILIISIIKIIGWNKDNDNTSKQIEIVQDEAKIEEVKDDDNTEIIEQPVKVPKANPYWDYIKMNMINVDFTELKKINNDVKGWIQVNGTNINYPFVQASDNKYYLNHSFNKSLNYAGWVFLDYRNNLTNNKNTIIYAHGRIDKTMFGSLRNILSSGWLNNSNNYVVKLSTEKENTLWQVFSVYHIPTTSDYIQTEFSSDDEFLQLITKLKDRSMFNFNTDVNSNDNILTLSTCYSDTEKVVLHAKLIKRSDNNMLTSN